MCDDDVKDCMKTNTCKWICLGKNSHPTFGACANMGSIFVLLVFIGWYVNHEYNIIDNPIDVSSSVAAAWAGAFAASLSAGFAIYSIWNSNRQQKENTHLNYIKETISRVNTSISQVYVKDDKQNIISTGSEAIDDILNRYFEGDASCWVVTNTCNFDAVYSSFTVAILDLISNKSDKQLISYYSSYGFSFSVLYSVLFMAVYRGKENMVKKLLGSFAYEEPMNKMVNDVLKAKVAEYNVDQNGDNTSRIESLNKLITAFDNNKD